MKPLKPVMAAILAASLSLLPAGAAFASYSPVVSPSANGTPPLSEATANEKAIAHDKSFEARLISLVDSKPEVRKDVGARLVKFILNRGQERQYLTDGLLDDKVNIAGATKVAQDWPGVNQKKGNSGKVAALYYVLGMDADKAPAWAPAGYEDEFKPNAVWSGRLAAALHGDKWDSTKRVAQSGAVNDTTALLDSAANWAQKILDDARTKGEIHSSVAANATTGVNPPTTAKTPGSLESAGGAFSFDDLYKKGARWGNVYAPGDDGYRTLSMKVYTTKDANGFPISQIGVVDITANDITSPSAPKFIDVSRPGDSDIQIHSGGRHYTVTVGTDGTVTLKRAGAPDGEGCITTSISDLSQQRNDQIKSCGQVMIGGNAFYALGQGGGKGSYLFFSKAQMDGMTNGNAHPELMGDIAVVTGDGSTVPAPYTKGIDIGKLGDGTAWHMEYDVATRSWRVVSGPGDSKDDKSNPANPANPASPTDPANPTQPAPPAPATAPKTLQEAIDQAKADKSDKTQVWAEDDGNSGFDDASLALIRIMSNQRSDGMTHFKVLFDPSLGVSNNSFEFQAINNGIRLLHIRGVKNYVALEYGVGTQYYDLQNFANYVQHTNDSSLAYAQAGSYDVSKGQMSDVTSADIVEDVLTHYLKVKSDDAMLATVRSRITDHAKGRGFVISGNTTTLYMGVGEEGRTIWPKDIASGDTGTNDKMTGLRGPGTAVDVTGGETGDFKKEMDIGSGRTATLVKTEDHAAVYASEEDENVGGKTSTVKVWSVMLEYKNDNGLASRSKALPVFGTGKDRYQLPANLHMQGLPDVKLPSSTQLGMLYGSNQENGAIVAYRFTAPDAQGGSNVRDKKGNCGGPVLWWGNVTKEKAQAACESDGKL